jgi:hypothetical protein
VINSFQNIIVAKLQDRLIKHYAGSIVIHTQRGQGMSNLVFSDKLSLGDDIAAAGKYKYFVRISRYRSAKMILVHADRRSLRMVVTWPGLLLFLLQVELVKSCLQ